MHEPLVIGHRGAAAYALENTALSFRRAIELKVDFIEFDVRESLDGEFIIIHDNHLGRISPRRDVVCKTHSAVLKRIDLYQGQRLLTLPEAFQIIPEHIGLMVELKALRSVPQLVRIIDGELNSRRLLITSFDLALLLKVQACSQEVPLGVVSRVPDKVSKARGMGVTFSDVCLDFQCMDLPLMSLLRRRSYRVFAWTADRPKDIKRMLDLHVDGIISNRPDLVQEICFRKCALS